MNSQTNIKSSVSDSLTAKIYILSNHMSYPIIITFIDPGKTLAPWVLALELESYLSYIKKVIKKILQNRDPSQSSLDDFSNIYIYNISISKYYFHNPT